MSEFLKAAKEYLALGLHPIPVEPRGKRPLLASWREYFDRQPTQQEVEAWWTNTPTANVALVMGRGMYAVDIDGPDGEAALALEGVVFPPGAPVSETGKGRHIFFHGEMANAVGILPHVDVRGHGGYVVAAPSVHPSGAVYRWATEMLPVALLPGAPEPLQRVLARPKTAEHAPAGDDWLTMALAGVTEGGRDVTCTRIAGYLWRKGLPQDAIESILQPWAERCSPAFPADEVSKCVASIVKREGGQQEIDLAADLLTVSALYAKTPDTRAWVWQDYLAEGTLALLVAEEKAGKSTWFYALASAVSKGQPFLSRRTKKSSALILAVEEDATDVRLRAQFFGMTPDDPVYFRIGDLPHTERTHEQVRNIVLERDVRLVVLDTLGHYLASVLESENDNFAVLKAVRPWLLLARQTRTCVLLVHHTGKGGQVYRGASAFGGVVDQILTLRKYDNPPNERGLWARGRYRETPRDLHFALYHNRFEVLS